MKKIPAYRKRVGYTQAIVTLTDSTSGKRRDYWLGEFGRPSSREMYYRVLADWEAGGRRFPDREPPPPPRGPGRGKPDTAALTVAGLISAYWKWARGYYSRDALCGIRMALRVLRQTHGSSEAASFGPNALRVLRDAMVLGDTTGDRPRGPWCRKTVNTRVGTSCGCTGGGHRANSSRPRSSRLCRRCRRSSGDAALRPTTRR